MTFGAKVKDARKKHSLTQGDLARILGVSRRTVTAWETDTALPRTRKVYQKLADTLEVSMNYLLEADEETLTGSEDGAKRDSRREAVELVNELSGLFSGGQMAEEDMDELMFAVQNAYFEAKRKKKRKSPQDTDDSILQPEGE